MAELKPCPFCGCEATHEYDSDWGLVVRCTTCGAIMTDTIYPIKREAIQAWNTRHKRTCKRIGIKDRDVLCQIEWKCSACGYPLYSDHDSYCSECGAKVVQ